ncbi:unnamed protein product [Ixodes pacificus]
MKIQAFLIIAVVAALLPIVKCAPGEDATEEEDRSCEKRDKEAAEVGVSPIPSCNYYCEPVKGSGNYEKKYYPDGTSCKYNNELTSKCIDNTCEHPESTKFQKDKGTNQENKEEGNQNEEEKNKEKQKEEGPKEDEHKEEKAEEDGKGKDVENKEGEEKVAGDETSTGTEET